jgi:hypothetical protein
MVKVVRLVAKLEAEVQRKLFPRPHVSSQPSADVIPDRSAAVIPAEAQRSGGPCFCFVILSAVRRSRTQSKDPYTYLTVSSPTEAQRIGGTCFCFVTLSAVRRKPNAVEGPLYLPQPVIRPRTSVLIERAAFKLYGCFWLGSALARFVDRYHNPGLSIGSQSR